MRRLALLATASLIASSAYAASAPAPCPTGASAAPNYAASNGGFGVIDGQWYSPNGSAWTPHGINVMYFGSAPSAADILAADPGTNFVRLALYGFPEPSQIQSVVDDYTAHGIFVLLDQHSSSDGQNRGGGTGSIFTDALLQQDTAWYAAMGKAFANNPYVGAASTNEPPAGDPAALSDWQLAEYNAFRQAGNNNPFWLEVTAWADPNAVNQGYKASDYARMTNAAWDLHPYPWIFPTSADATQDTAILQQFVAGAQKITSADGIMPVNALEYGNSTTGQAIDSNWQPVVQAIINSGIGGAAWAWGSGNPGDGLQNPSTNYGAMVAGYNASSGSAGCVESPIATPVTTLTAADQQTVPLNTAETAVAAVQSAWSAPAASSPLPASSDAISPGVGSLTDAQGNSYMITSSGSVMEGNTYIPGGGGTAALTIINGVIYGRDDGHGPVNPGGWFTFSNGYWTPSAAPPLAAPQALPLTAQPVTAPPLAPASTVQTAPALAASPLSINEVAALALGGNWK